MPHRFRPFVMPEPARGVALVRATVLANRQNRRGVGTPPSALSRAPRVCKVVAHCLTSLNRQCHELGFLAFDWLTHEPMGWREPGCRPQSVGCAKALSSAGCGF